MQLGKDTIKKLAFLVGGAILFSWLLNNFGVVQGLGGTVWGLLFPFILGLILAYILNIPMRFIEKLVFRGKGGRAARPVSFILTIIAVLALLALIVFLVVPQLWQSIYMLVTSIPGYLTSLQKTLEPYYEYVPQIQSFIESLQLDWNSLSSQLMPLIRQGADSLFSSVGGIASSLFGFASSLVSGTTSFIIAVIIACYLLLDKEHLIAQAKAAMMAYIPEKRYKSLMGTLSLINRTFSRFVSGQCTEALVVTILFLTVLSIGGFKYSLLIAVLVGLMSFIPIFGAFIACIVGALLILASSGLWRAIAFVIVYFIVQQIDGNLIYPRIIGNSISLPPLWVLVAVTVGGGLMGMFGMLFFIPVASVVYVLVRRAVGRRLHKKGMVSPTVAVAAGRPPKKVPKTPEFLKKFTHWVKQHTGGSSNNSPDDTGTPPPEEK